jgi:hypothetical protein
MYPEAQLVAFTESEVISPAVFDFPELVDWGW